MKIKKRQNPRKIKGFSDFCLMELVTGIGPVTPTLPRWCSTAEPHQHSAVFEWILRWNLVVKKCCFCFTKVVLLPLEPHQHSVFLLVFLRWNWVVKKCCFCFTKAILLLLKLQEHDVLLHKFGAYSTWYFQND